MEHDTNDCIPEKCKTPFTPLGIGPDDLAWFIGRGNRLVKIPIIGIVKKHLLALAPLDYWESTWAPTGRIYWFGAFDFVLEVTFLTEFDPEKVPKIAPKTQPARRVDPFDGWDPREMFSKIIDGKWPEGVLDRSDKAQIVIARNHPAIMKKLGCGRGYHRTLCRHPQVIDPNKVVWVGGQSRRCIVLALPIEGVEK